MNGPSEKLKEKIIELSKFTYRAATILSKCKSCGTCMRYCPLKIRAFNSEGKAITIKTNQSCGGCSVCFKRCRNNAIILKKILK
jgi:Pyruvate/2-oxoacid:ferredoxin oxidoreductase delta subunit